MVVKQILGRLPAYPVGTRTIERVYLEWFELDKRRMRKTLESGEEIGICLDAFEVHPHSHVPLQEGDVLYADEERVIVAAVAPCELTVIEVSSMKEMGRLCFELGNRHLSLKIEENRVTIPYDAPTFHYLDRMGFCLEKVEGSFSHFTVCHGHDHMHDQGDVYSQGEHTGRV